MVSRSHSRNEGTTKNFVFKHKSIATLTSIVLLRPESDIVTRHELHYLQLILYNKRDKYTGCKISRDTLRCNFNGLLISTQNVYRTYYNTFSGVQGGVKICAYLLKWGNGSNFHFFKRQLLSTNVILERSLQLKKEN